MAILDMIGLIVDYMALYMQFTLISNLTPELIVWEDISACDETWATEEEIKSWLSDVADAHVEQIGYVIYEDERIILVSDSQIESMNLYGNVNKIPKACIISRTSLVPLSEQVLSKYDVNSGSNAILWQNSGTLPSNLKS